MNTPASVDRRASDIAAALLAKRVDDVEREGNGTKDTLTKHVADCAAMQKKGLVIGCLILGWVVAHSPEASKIAALAVKVMAP